MAFLKAAHMKFKFSRKVKLSQIPYRSVLTSSYRSGSKTPFAIRNSKVFIVYP